MCYNLFMNINPINRLNKITMRGGKSDSEKKTSSQSGDKLMKELDKMSMINNVNISLKDYELNLSAEELEKEPTRII